MRTAVLWGLLALLCQHTLVSSHILGRPSSTSDLTQLKVRTHIRHHTCLCDECTLAGQGVNNVYSEVKGEKQFYSSSYSTSVVSS